MAYNKNLYSSNVSALDAGIIYDQNQQMMQDEINAAVRDGDIVVGLADNLASEQNQFSTGEFIERTTGGDASLSDGDGYLVLIRGTSTHIGYVAKSVEMEITHASGSQITAEIDDDTFLGQMVTDSGTFVTEYDGSSWDYSPASYGIIVTGTPVENDTITVSYRKEERGTITQSDPQTFVSTGWNLYNYTNGYARVLKYHETYGFGISGTYTALQFSSTLTGEKSSVTVTDGKFSITEDGYIWVTGGNNTDTAIWMTWSDWQSSANGGTWQAYTESTVSFASVMTSYFPYGLMAVGGYQDEIDFSLKKATQNVGRLVYNSTNLETARGYRTAVDYDEDYIYYGLPTPVVNEINIANSYAAYDHGIEYFTDTDTAVYAQTLYGVNLKNRLERDVLTISQQTLTDSQKQQVQTNLGIKDVLKSTVNPNLLDNWYFVGGGSQLGDGIFPINSNGKNYYEGQGYCIDRWKGLTDSDVIAVQSGNIVIGTGSVIAQIIQNGYENLVGKTVTLSALVGVSLLTISGVVANNGSSVVAGNGYYQAFVSTDQNAKTLQVILNNISGGGVVKAIKLELGSTQTLAHQENGAWVLNEIPNFEEQLLRCKTSTADSNDNYANQDIMTNYMVANPNLLDNWYFVGGGSQQGGGQFPINQRGQTIYNSKGYAIDRWRTRDNSQTCSLNAAYLQIGYPASTQYLNFETKLQEYITKSLAGKTVTASILFEEAPTERVTLGVLYTGGFKQTDVDVRNTVFGSTSFTLDSNASGTLTFFVQNATTNALTLKIKAVKLELGNTQTLAHQENGTWVLNEIPDYDEQLYRCCASAADSSDIYANKPYTSVGSVYVGTSAPADPSIKIWLDTDEPGMSAVSSVNGKTGTVVIDTVPMTLLWTNASPTSSFAAQTVSINLTYYSFILIGINGWNDDETITYQIIRKGDSAAHIQFRNAQITATCAVFQRNISVSDSGVNFGDCIGKGNVTSTTPATSNSGLVPAIIYGIKGVAT